MAEVGGMSAAGAVGDGVAGVVEDVVVDMVMGAGVDVAGVDVAGAVVEEGAGDVAGEEYDAVDVEA